MCPVPPSSFLTATLLLVFCSHIYQQASAHPYGAGSCTYPDSKVHGEGLPGHGGFGISLKPSPVDGEYVPETTYAVTISRGGASYNGFLVQAVKMVPGVPNTSPAGVITPSDTRFQQLKFCGGKPYGAITHTLSRSTMGGVSDSFLWKSPAAGTGTLTFHLVGAVSQMEWYGQKTPIILSLTEKLFDGSQNPKTATEDQGKTTLPAAPLRAAPKCAEGELALSFNANTSTVFSAPSNSSASATVFFTHELGGVIGQARVKNLQVRLKYVSVDHSDIRVDLIHGHRMVRVVDRTLQGRGVGKRVFQDHAGGDGEMEVTISAAPLSSFVGETLGGDWKIRVETQRKAVTILRAVVTASSCFTKLV